MPTTDIDSACALTPNTVANRDEHREKPRGIVIFIKLKVNSAMDNCYPALTRRNADSDEFRKASELDGY